MRFRPDNLVVDRRRLEPPYWTRAVIACSTALLVLGVVLSGASRPAFGQDSGTNKMTVPDHTPDILSSGLLPDLILMRNAAGENVLVPKARYEDFERFLQSGSDLSRSATIAEPLAQLDLVIRAERDVARVAVAASIAFDEPIKSWRSIPLGLGQLQLVPSPDSAVPPVKVVTEGNGNVGYVWRIAPGTDQHQELRANALARIITNPRGSTLRIDLPVAPTTLQLRLPQADWELSVVNVSGTGTEAVERLGANDGESVFKIHTKSGGTLVLSWNKKIAMEAVQSIEAESNTKFAPTNELNVFRATTQLKISGPGRLGGRWFLITLPKGSQWREPVGMPLSFPGYRVAVREAPKESVPTANPNADPNAPKTTDREITLALEFEESFPRSEADVTIEWLIAFDKSSEIVPFTTPIIEGIQRHSGTMDCMVPRNISMNWIPNPHVVLSKQSTATDGDTLVYSFRFAEQPVSIATSWKSIARTPSLRAQQTLTLGENRTTLAGNIELNTDPLQLPRLQFEAKGWTIDQLVVRPSGRQLPLSAMRLTSPNTQGDQTDVVSEVPISETELMDSGTNGTDRANRPTTSSTTPNEDALRTESTSVNNVARPVSRLEFQLSRSSTTANGSSVTEQALAAALPMISWLDPDSQQRIQITPAGELTVQSTIAKLSERHSEPLVLEPVLPTDLNPPSTALRSKQNRVSMLKYRVRESQSWTAWTGYYTLLGSSVVANASAVLSLGEERIRLDQSWRCIASGQVPKSILIQVPKEWMPPSEETNAPTNTLECFVDGVSTKLDWILRDDRRTADDVPNNHALVRIHLADVATDSSGISEFVLSLRKHVDAPEFSAQPTPIALGLAILQPDGAADTVTTENSVGRAIADPSLHCEFNNTTSSAIQDRRGSDLPFEWNEQDRSVHVVVTRRGQPTGQLVQIERIWLQSILNAVERRDRYVARLQTNLPRIVVHMPFEGAMNSEFLVDGRRAVVFQDPSNPQIVTIDLHSKGSTDATKEQARHTIEIFSSPPLRSSWIRELSATLPTIEQADGYTPIIWQVIVPRTEHLVASSNHLVPGYRWQWNDLWFARRSDWTQGNLERDLGATVLPAIGTQTNQYALFSLESGEPMTLWLAPRYLLWLPVASFVLLAAFAASEFRWLRHPWIPLLLLLVGLVLSQWAIDASVMMIQCFAFAMTIAVVFYVIRWSLDRRARLRSVFASRSMTSGSHLQRPLSNSGMVPGLPSASTAAPPSLPPSPTSESGAT